ncbi:hypothetical protein ABIE45_005804 [Methylobacterium sp. OAE515]|jgi:hypothetical protein|uniref:hypothetical protein n=1 Tax=Methylobacterium sp. OAE515 TaxID=2817895 RepID=UPI001A004868
MNDDPEAPHERAAIQHMMRRLHGFAGGLGLDERVTRRIAEGVAADMPIRTDEERVLEAQTRLAAALMASRMSDAADPVLEAVEALRAAGITVEPVGEEMDRWRIGDLLFSDAELVRIAMSRGLMEDKDA